ncbi:hypothetical protein SACC_06450 [Saccharolobus caldissimus]|uniref:Uncharacterized protein n=1 Tax=Saccharolobus caldissimus TaxID=1702097 RepID=A0AAQ4CP97_9CREN|nr:hypothetical protein SACC_06450 [Saccharolobus caldissimus]
MKSSTLMLGLIIIDSIIAYIYTKNNFIIIYSIILILILLLVSKFILKKLED